MRPVSGARSNFGEKSESVCVRAAVRVCLRTGDGSADFCGGCLSHLQRRLLAVPGGVGRADQVGGVFERTLGEAVGQHIKRGGEKVMKKIKDGK